MNKLTDLEICKKIAIIEGYKTSVTNSLKGVWASMYENECYDWYNPLTDDALCFRLMVKYGICVEPDDCNAFSLDKETQEPIYEITHEETLNKAICLAIIAANED